MPITQRWIDLGDGVEQFVVDDILDGSSSDEEPICGIARDLGHVPSTPPGSPVKSSIGLNTPPDSGSKNARPVSASLRRPSHDDYEFKLKVQNSRGQTMSRFGFRWYDARSQGFNSESQIRAGLFRNPGSDVPPPASGDELKSAQWSHLTPRKKLSPFISVFENFLPALHRALKSREEAYIAIVDLRQVVEDSLKRFPDATEVIWPIKVVIKRHGFKLRNHYKGFEWLIHGIIEGNAIIKTVKVSDLRDFARTGRVRQMRGFLNYVSLQQHAFGLLNRLGTKLPKMGYRTGVLVGKVLDHVQIPKEHKMVLARKIKNMIRFDAFNSVPRERAYIRGVYGIPMTDSDREIDADDDFLVDSDGYDSNETYIEDAADERSGRRIKTIGTNDAITLTDDYSYNTSSEDDSEDEQARLDAQLHATMQEWLQPEQSKMLQMSHVEIQRLPAEQLGQFKLARSSASSSVVDLTNDADDKYTDDVGNEPANDADDDSVIEVAARASDEDVIVVATAKRANRTMDLAIRTSSVRSTVGPRGLRRLEADADANMDVMEVIQYD